MLIQWHNNHFCGTSRTHTHTQLQAQLSQHTIWYSSWMCRLSQQMQVSVENSQDFYASFRSFTTFWWAAAGCRWTYRWVRGLVKGWDRHTARRWRRPTHLPPAPRPGRHNHLLPPVEDKMFENSTSYTKFYKFSCFSSCLCGFLVSSHSPKTWIGERCIPCLQLYVL